MSRSLQTPLPLSQAAIRYGWDCLAARAGVDGRDWHALGVKLVYGQLPVEVDRPVLCITAAAPGSWQNLITFSESRLDNLPAANVMPDGQPLPVGELLPVLLWGEGQSSRFATMVAPNICQVHVDILGSTLFMLSRWEEMANAERDIHGRFPAAASAGWRQGFLARPIIDEYALVLQSWLKQLLPGWQPAEQRFTVQLSHDIDSLRRFTPEQGLLRPGGGLRAVGRELSSGQGWGTVKESLRDIGYSRRHEPAGSYFQAIGKLAELATRYRFRAAFYFMTAPAGAHDNGYNLDSPLGQLALNTIHEQSHEIGLHPGYSSFNNPLELQNQISRFTGITKAKDFGGRQHYLRFKAPDTWHHWADAGFRYDSTLGFATSGGFRAGTCHSFRPFDLEADREIDIEEVPLVAMDVTFTSPAYLGLAPQQVIEEILLLARRCQAVKGTFTLLWHNATMNAPWDSVYESILRSLRELMDASNG